MSVRSATATARLGRRAARLAAVAAIVAAIVGPAADPAMAEPTLTAVPVATSLDSPVAFGFLPDGRVVYAERHTGSVRIRNLTTGADTQIHLIGGVNSEGERGAMGIAVHPAWPTPSFLYVFVTRSTATGLRMQVVRIRVQNDAAAGVRVIFSVPNGPARNHIGGRIAFGPDRKLYLVIGDHADPANSQDLTSNVAGKILRIDPDGSIPSTNPFSDAVWAFGIRNSIGFAFDPATGRLWEQDNGPECNDEINRIIKGGNFGWGPQNACPNTNNSGPTPRIQPRYTFVDTLGLTGVAFCDGCGFGEASEGDLLVGAVNNGTIHRFDLNATRTGVASGPSLVLDHTGPVLSIERAPSGRLYFSDFGAIYRLDLA